MNYLLGIHWQFNYVYYQLITMNPKVLLAFMLLNVAILSQDCPQQYSDFINSLGKDKDTDPLKYQQRQQLFCARLQQINDHNANNPSYLMSVNQFTDQLPEQRNNFLKIGIDPNTVAPVKSSANIRVGSGVGTVPLSKDWSADGKVSPVKNQGSCGSCWVFTTVGVYQAYLLVKGFNTYDLSEEYILECSTIVSGTSNPQSDCSGGYVTDSLKATKFLGIPEEAKYPYAAGSFGSSASFPSTVANCNDPTIPYIKFQTLEEQKLGAGAVYNQTTLTGYQNMTTADLQALLVDSPVGVLINADSGFMSYSSGVYSGCPAFATSFAAINHAVTLVGYDSNGNWIIKNSWGTGWGQNGYATISNSNDCALTAYVYQLTWQYRTLFGALLMIFLMAMF